mgnify:CR=1 FL=1
MAISNSQGKYNKITKVYWRNLKFGGKGCFNLNVSPVSPFPWGSGVKLIKTKTKNPNRSSLENLSGKSVKTPIHLSYLNFHLLACPLDTPIFRLVDNCMLKVLGKTKYFLIGNVHHNVSLNYIKITQLYFRFNTNKLIYKLIIHQNNYKSKRELRYMITRLIQPHKWEKGSISKLPIKTHK